MKTPFKALLIALAIYSTATAETVIEYKGQPVVVTVSSKVANVISFPEEIKEVFSSSKEIKVNFAQGNTKLVVSVPDHPVDLIVFTKSGKLYTLNLDPEPLPSQVISIRPNSEEVKRVKAKLFEERNDYESLIAELIKAVANDTPPEGYEVQLFDKTIDTPDLVFVCEAKYSGWEYAVYKCAILNKSSKKLWLRETSPLMKTVIPKLINQNWSSIRAISFSWDVLEPRGKGKRWFTKLYIVSENPDKPFSSTPLYDTLRRNK